MLGCETEHKCTIDALQDVSGNNLKSISEAGYALHMTPALLHDDVQKSVSHLRACLRALVVGAGSDPRRPQDVHRKFGLDRVLTWKVSRLVKAEVAEEALRQLPGEESFEIFLAALQRAGALPDEVQRTREAVKAVFSSVEKHVGDRSTLELVLDSVPKGRDALMVSRKLAFRGNSGLWGMQARVRTQLLVLFPSADAPDLIDSATVAGWVDFRRLRPDAAWRVFQRRNLKEGGAAPRVQSLDASQPPGGPMLLNGFCSNVPELLTVTEGELNHYEIGPSAPGSNGSFTLFSGFMQRGHGSRWAIEADDCAEFGANILAPVEHLNFDLLVHRSLPFIDEARLRLSSAAFNDGLLRTPYTLMPIQAEREDLGQPPLLAHAQVPRMGELVDAVFQRLGWSLEDFRAVRFEVAYPPFPSVAVLRVPLQKRPD
jgi:hypothetical protein